MKILHREDDHLESKLVKSFYFTFPKPDELIKQPLPGESCTDATEILGIKRKNT